MVMKVNAAGASVIGSGHRIVGIPCQDSVCVHNGEICVACICDGAGSIPHSEEASYIICSYLVKRFAENFDLLYQTDFRDKLVKECKAMVNEYAHNIEAGCTVVLMAISSDGRYIMCHLGDGIVFGIDDEKRPYILSGPDNGAEPNQTFFISSLNVLDHFRICKGTVNNMNGVVMCSDGAGVSLWNKGSGEFANALKILYEWINTRSACEVEKMIKDAMETMFMENTQDDMSIAVMDIANTENL